MGLSGGHDMFFVVLFLFLSDCFTVGLSAVTGRC